MSRFLRDALFSLRQLSRHRSYALTAVLSMALGIGATTAVYSVLYGVLVDPYPYHDADRIASIMLATKDSRLENLNFSLAEMEQLRHAKAVADVQGSSDRSMVATDGDLPESVRVLQMTGNGLQFLDAPPLMGRVFTAAEAPRGVAPPPVAVISLLFWKKHFGSQPDVLGRELELNHARFTVIGVVGPRFTWHDADVYVPLPADPEPNARYQTLIRLAPAVSTGKAAVELDGLVRTIGHSDSELLPKDSFHIAVETLNDTLLGQFKGTLTLLFVSVLLLLLIGCGNVSILMLARGTARQQELATRAALGASRLQLVRQVLTESVVLSVCGGLLGLLFAYGALALIVRLIPEYAIPHEVVIRLNVPVLLLSTVVSVLVGVQAGLSPALQFSRPAISQWMQTSGSRGTTTQGHRTRTALMVAQTALTVLLLAGAGASVRNFLQAYAANLGFDPHGVLTLQILLPEKSMKAWQERVNYHDAVLEAIRAVPGVTGVAISQVGTPPDSNWTQSVHAVGGSDDVSRQSALNLVSAEYFSVLRVPLLQGRILTRAEVLRGAPVAVVSQSFARQYFPGSDPLGRQIQPAGLMKPPSFLTTSPTVALPYEVIGVVADVRNDGLHRPALPQVYVPSSIVTGSGTTLLVRTEGQPNAFARPVSATLHKLNQNQATMFVWSLDDYLSTFVWSHERFIAVLFTVFSVVALSLAALGLASVVAFTVQQRTREFGIRLALGSPRRSVLWLALLSVIGATGAGVVLGVLLSVGLSNVVFRWTQSTLRDGPVLAAIALLFLAASAAACLLPALRAARISPMKALREG